MRGTICLLLLCFFTSCVQHGNIDKVARALQDKYDAVLTDGRKNNQTVKEFHEIFPSAFSWISYFTGEYGTPEWNSQVGLYDRYILTMQSTIELDQSRTRIARFDEPGFTLVEVESVYPGLDGTYRISYGDTQAKFGADKWEAIKKDGDFSRIGIVLDKNRPVQGFSNALTKN